MLKLSVVKSAVVEGVGVGETIVEDIVSGHGVVRYEWWRILFHYV